MSGTVVIRSADADHELRHLTGWLRGEDDLRGRISLVEKPLEAGQMGGVLDSVAVVVTSGTVTTFVKSFFDWLSRRREIGKVMLKVTRESGEHIELECGSASDAQAVLSTVRNFLDGRVGE